jgi:hypothetical protein
MTAPQRLRWLFTEYRIYYVTAGTYNRRRIPDRPALRGAFIQFGLHAVERRVWVGRYVIMPGHIRLFAGFGPESISVSARTKSFNSKTRFLKP